MSRGGSLELMRWRGAPVLLHWSAVVVPLLIGGLHFRPFVWCAYLGLVLLHELGHAALVRRYGGEVVETVLHGLGGHCRFTGVEAPFARAAVSWGGVLAQLGVLVATLLVAPLAGHRPSPELSDLLAVGAPWNLASILFNLLPIAPLDGATAWPIVPMLWRRVRRARAERHAARLRTEAAARDALPDADLPPELEAQLADLRDRTRH